MPVIGLIGYMEKYDFVINLAKTINIMNKSVLVVDATLDRKLKYIVPALNNIGKAYVTQYNSIDFAVGFDSMHDIENYMCDQGINIGLYDYILIDMDSPKSYEFFRTRGIDKMYFFMTTSVLSTAKDRDIVKAIRVYNQDEIKMTKVLHKGFMSRAAEDYFEKQVEDYNINWQEPSYEIPDEETDKLANIDSQFSGIIGLKKHSKIYTSTIADITSEIIDDVTSKEVLKEIKRRKD
ncbi:MAG: hypothetical protein PHP54_03490 [Clostridia bacterium]|nr:hypothetical protein [Clostridia bacterium]